MSETEQGQRCWYCEAWIGSSHPFECRLEGEVTADHCVDVYERIDALQTALTAAEDDYTMLAKETNQRARRTTEERGHNLGEIANLKAQLTAAERERDALLGKLPTEGHTPMERALLWHLKRKSAETEMIEAQLTAAHERIDEVEKQNLALYMEKEQANERADAYRVREKGPCYACGAPWVLEPTEESQP